MSLGDITSANASGALIVDGVFSAGITLMQFSTDQSISSDEVVYTESRMGVDGSMVSGFVPSIKTVTLSFEPTSPSVDDINQVLALMESNRTVYECTLIFTVQSLGKVYSYQCGVIKSGKIMPDNKKLLEPVSYKLEFARMIESKI